MIRTGSTPGTFLVDFSKAKRKKRASLGAALEGVFVRVPAPALVDGLAIAQAICAVMDACDFADVHGRVWLWNDYAVFLARADHDRLRDVEELLRRDLMVLLNEEIVRREARMPDGFQVRLLVSDEGEEIVAGAGVVRVKHAKDLGQTPAVPGEITMRSDRIVKPSAPAPDTTDRDTGLRVRSGAGSATLPEGRRVCLGRAAPDAGADHVALPGAGGKVSRRHVGVLVKGAEAEVQREPGANPVEVGGRALGDGESVTVALPVELSLSLGAWKGTLCR